MTSLPSTARVETASGTLQGKREGTVLAWLGIPYAAPPVGELRFRAPAPAPSWSGVRPATRFGAASVQPDVVPRPLAALLGAREGRSEDCLTLNVWSPAADEARRPVLLWIHGGAFSVGSGAQYRGAELAALGDIVVVTLNYRLNAFGFVDLAGLLGDERLAANAGLLDQLAALRWVRDNIAAFGGDPNAVTLAGESAGAGSVTSLMIADAARGLFRGAIAESGALNHVGERRRTMEVAYDFCARLGVGAENVDALWHASAEKVQTAMESTKAARVGRLNPCPVFDGDLLPASRAEARKKTTANVPLLIGTNHDEYRLFTALKLGFVPLTRPRLANTLAAAFGGDEARRILRHYPHDDAGMNALGTDLAFTMPALDFADQHAAHAPTWRYRFDFPSARKSLRAAHALELLFLWPMPRTLKRLVLGRTNGEADALAARMKQHWIHFVREGRPAEGWPGYDSTERATMLFDAEDRVERDPDRGRREAWAGRDAAF